MTFNTLRTLTEDLLKIVRGSKIAESETISRRQIEDWIHQYRAVLLPRSLQKGYTPNPDYTQEISNLSITDGVTDLALPRTIDMNYKSGFTFVGLTDGTEIQMIPEHRANWQQYKKYTATEPLWFLSSDDGKIHIVNPGTITEITVRGIFENPAEVGRYVNPNTSQPLFDLDTRYPVPNNVIPTIKEMILQKELNVIAQAPSDNINDDEHVVTSNVE